MKDLNSPRRRALLGAAAYAGVFAPLLARAQSSVSIRVGGTLALTGPLSPTAQIHKLAGEIYVEQLNKRGGLLGRQVEWILRDDQSKPDLARTLYEQLVTVDKVDLLVGPYATGAILSAMGVAQRYGKLLVHHTMGIPALAKYDMQFPTYSLGSDPARTVPTMLFETLGTLPKPPRSVAVVTSKFPSVHFLSLGAREVLRSKGMRELLFLEWDFGNRDFGPIANRLKDAKPDFIWFGAIGVESGMLLESMKKIDYVPPLQFHLYPAPGPLLRAPSASGALSVTIYEDHEPYLRYRGAADLSRLYRERASKAGMPETTMETQAAASFSAWQVLEAAVQGTRSLDDRTLADWLKRNRVETIQGTLRFDGPNNYGPDLVRIKQIQAGKWVIVWPSQFAAPGHRPLGG